MVTSNHFSLEIVPSDNNVSVEQFTEGGNYFALPNKTEYKIKLCNQGDAPCDVDVSVDNERIGSWRVDPHNCVIIEHPSDDSHRFTFFSETSTEVKSSDVVIGSHKNGLVSATFYPKKKQHILDEPISLITRPPSQPYNPFGSLRESSFEVTRSASITPESRSSPTRGGYESGATLLGRKSNQIFGQTTRLKQDEIDHDNITTIVLRLIAKKEKPTYYRYQ